MACGAEKRFRTKNLTRLRRYLRPIKLPDKKKVHVLKKFPNLNEGLSKKKGDSMDSVFIQVV
jgi:hypothetical protein